MIWKILAEMSHALCLWSILSKGANFGISCPLLLNNNIIKRYLRVWNLFWELGEYSFTKLQFDIKIEKDEVYSGTKPHGAEFQTITGKLQAAKHTCNVFHV